MIGSVGSATLLYGLALVYGATGSTQFEGIAAQIHGGHLAHGVYGDPMFLTGLGLVMVGFAFKASVAPFHQWTPDVYEGAPTPITAFMATATKAAALGVLIRFFDVAVIGAHHHWAPALAAIAAITIIVGNVGALSQTSLKRILGYSSVGQAGYMLAGVVVGTRLGVQATVLYLCFYLMMNMGAFAVIVANQNARADGEDLSGLAGLGARNPWLAWPLTISMLALAGHPRHGRLHRQVPADPRARRRRLHLAGDRARDRLDDLAGLLPARGRGRLDAPRDPEPGRRLRLSVRVRDRHRGGKPGADRGWFAEAGRLAPGSAADRRRLARGRRARGAGAVPAAGPAPRATREPSTRRRARRQPGTRR